MSLEDFPLLLLCVCHKETASIPTSCDLWQPISEPRVTKSNMAQMAITTHKGKVLFFQLLCIDFFYLSVRLLKICQMSSLCRPAQGLCDFRDKGQQSGDHFQNHRLHPSPGQRRDLLGARRRFVSHLGT